MTTISPLCDHKPLIASIQNAAEKAQSWITANKVDSTVQTIFNFAFDTSCDPSSPILEKLGGIQEGRLSSTYYRYILDKGEEGRSLEYATKETIKQVMALPQVHISNFSFTCSLLDKSGSKKSQSFSITP